MPWYRARVEDAWLETRTARTVVLEVPGWPGHDAGQHVDVRLTAADGYTATRTYSVASAPETGRLVLTVQLVTDGEVSPWLVEQARPGDQLEVRGPIGGWFRWSARMPEPVLLVAGGSGIVPLMAMVRERVRAGTDQPFHLVYSARTPDHVIYTDELHALGLTTPGLRVERVFTRAGLPQDGRPPGRLHREDLPAVSTTRVPPVVYVCGPGGFVETATGLLLGLGHDAAAVRTERFGPSS
ncbi:ferredoxin reductase [Phycicoccus endophyticus]|uniref:Ferredoxin reductase n=1 Tax=Phycicoccus endophyticus TaxID=1690220 RepID=A0A7G9R231_9MICO|nr:ferredoxin reductase [Phycicoccus endophyticus]NHI19699.1 oxidoreductase [Phycicoccus endophyticus]QNN49656.1 ferredoxin reductase [Phycicoccus endophyticus]